MTRTVYDLCGADDRRFSPYCWRTRLALAHKGLDADYEPVGFTEKEKIAFSGQTLVPVLTDGETTVTDSWRIACYLDEAYPDAPPLFDSPMARATARFINGWADGAIHPAVVKAGVLEILENCRAEDQAYFRESREERFGMPLETFADRSAEQRAWLSGVFVPVRAALTESPFLSGRTPAYADYIVAGSLAFSSVICPTLAFFSAHDPIRAWHERLDAALRAAGGTSVALPPLAPAAE